MDFEHNYVLRTIKMMAAGNSQLEQVMVEEYRKEREIAKKSQSETKVEQCPIPEKPKKGGDPTSK